MDVVRWPELSFSYVNWEWNLTTQRANATSEFYRASEKGIQVFKFGGIIRPVAWPTDRQPTIRSWEIQDQLSQPRTRLLMWLCSFGKARQIQLPNHQTKEISKRWPDNERHWSGKRDCAWCLVGHKVHRRSESSTQFHWERYKGLFDRYIGS